MKYEIVKNVFSELPDFYLGCVVAKGICNEGSVEAIEQMLSNEMTTLQSSMENKNIKEDERIAPYRQAFRELGINPNKYPSSIEAMVKRVIKGSRLNNINPVVDLANSLSLKYILPMGAHDLGQLDGGVYIRFSEQGEKFIPLGSDVSETLGDGELVYADADKIRTRRWVWRQSSIGCINEKSSDIFFPIDGFKDHNKKAVDDAVIELEQLLKKHFGCQTHTFFLDENNNSFEL